ncbi:hypothetical protein BLA29_014483 [Euroglyphus maynei]|uniref:Uncharacterized protein n=1 Tax=Euroglyphus maynei TaxID=6958 RepID=A0A1Y3BPC0_EURMA|nr:hypothetical protein BLA29_014483 [Euroglyphus maynei]
MIYEDFYVKLNGPNFNRLNRILL